MSLALSSFMQLMRSSNGSASFGRCSASTAKNASAVVCTVCVLPGAKPMAACLTNIHLDTPKAGVANLSSQVSQQKTSVHR